MKLSINNLKLLIREAKKTEGGDFLLARPGLTEMCASPLSSDSPGHEVAVAHTAPSEESRDAQSQLYQTMKNVGALTDMLDDDEDLPSWVQAKITKAADYIRAAKEYIEYEKQAPQGGIIRESQVDQLRQYIKQFVNGQLKETDDKTNIALDNIIREVLRGVNINDPVARDFKELKAELDPQEEEKEENPRAGPPTLTKDDESYEDDGTPRTPGTSPGTLRGGVTE